MDAVNIDALRRELETLRGRLERAFRPDTAAQGFSGVTLSTGHCAAVAVIVYELLGGEMISSIVGGHSHWLNRIGSGARVVDVDLTGDQFNRPKLQVAEAGHLYPDARVREPAELTEETLERARLLAERADILEAVRAIEAKLARRRGGGRR